MERGSISRQGFITSHAGDCSLPKILRKPTSICTSLDERRAENVELTSADLSTRMSDTAKRDLLYEAVNKWTDVVMFSFFVNYTINQDIQDLLRLRNRSCLRRQEGKLTRLESKNRWVSA